jgi:enoyl-CoA hydratase/carnithine racemase
LLNISRDGRVLRLTLARSDKRNALNARLVQLLVNGIREGNEDPSVGAILVDAEGPVFSAGMDLDEAPDVDAGSLNDLHVALFRSGLEVETPLIAAVQGPVFGGGLGLVANAHVAVASENAEFALTELAVGLWPFLVWPSVARAIGERRALELALTTRRFSARDALEWGLVHYVVPPHALSEKAADVARAIAGRSRETVQRGFRATADPSRAAELRAVQLASADFREGVAARKAKRPPVWPSNQPNE